MQFTPSNEPSDHEHDQNQLLVCSVCYSPSETVTCPACEESALQFLETDPTTNEEIKTNEA